MSDSTQHLIPPFARETAALKARKAEDNWNSRNPQPCLGYRQRDGDEYDAG
jgi:nuclear transport factor 2 (NTF2) superfamily protein